jgi:hypothetical protein
VPAVREGRRARAYFFGETCGDKMRTVVPLLCQLTHAFLVCSSRNGRNRGQSKAQTYADFTGGLAGKEVLPDRIGLSLYRGLHRR